ncbi:hypothetical protein ACHOLT_19525 [Desulfitobacterium sp. Sab5]|uniref:hypothetical protein n=1 Tax=Desulfitobacterium nosdiversum TaxID=3375356 RepID=UPI003CF2465B
MDTPNKDIELKNEGNSDNQGFQHDVNDLVDAAPEYTRNYGRTLGNHHVGKEGLLQSNTYIDHVSEPVNNTYI